MIIFGYILPLCVSIILIFATMEGLTLGELVVLSLFQLIPLLNIFVSLALTGVVLKKKFF